MNKYFLVHCFLLLLSVNLFSQRDTEDFEITIPEEKVQNSLYKNIMFIDSRYDVSNMGIVQLGAFNRKVKVVPRTSFSAQLSNVMNALTDTTAKEGELVFQLRQFSFAEITGAVSEKGYCYMRASLYVKSGDNYRYMNSIDTVILIKSMDVTRALFRNGSKVITGFIGANLVKEPAIGDQYSFNDIVNIDSIEKRKIKVYNSAEYTNGLYTNYESFMNQVPDKEVQVQLKGEKISSVKAMDSNGVVGGKIKSRDIYAIVTNGQPFIATDYGYYPLTKTNDDFYFTGKAKVTANSGDVIAASIFFGVIGGLIASNAEATFQMKIDHINGGFIRLREVKP